jgi:alpha-tubulin suppressor-like RCC1 family protein
VGTTEDANSPKRVTVGAGAGAKVSAVACGWRHTIAVAAAGDGDEAGLYTWGRCTNGRGLYKLNPVHPQRLKPPGFGFNPLEPMK